MSKPLPRLTQVLASFRSPARHDSTDTLALALQGGGSFGAFTCDVLAAEIDFELLRQASPVQLIIAATAVRDGRPRYFANYEITLEAVLASACVPSLHQAVQIDGEWYWDGGFTTNPPLVSLARLSRARDLLLVQIIPGEDASLPTSSSHILRRVQRTAFTAPLRKELEQLVGMKELMQGEGRWASREGVCPPE